MFDKNEDTYYQNRFAMQHLALAQDLQQTINQLQNLYFRQHIYSFFKVKQKRCAFKNTSFKMCAVKTILLFNVSQKYIFRKSRLKPTFPIYL